MSLATDCCLKNEIMISPNRFPSCFNEEEVLNFEISNQRTLFKLCLIDFHLDSNGACLAPNFS